MRFVVFVFALLVALAAQVEAAQTCVRIARDDSVQTDVDTTWYSKIYNVDTSKPVQAVILIDTYTAGNLTIALQGLVRTGNGADSTWGGASTESIISLVSRASIASGGRYFLQATPAAAVGASGTTGGVLPFMRVSVATDNAAVAKFDAYLIYHIPDQTFGPEEVSP